MIQLTRLNRQPLAVNSDLIKFIAQAHDTVITLVTGEKIVVLEHADQVMELIIAFRQRVLSGLSGLWIDPGMLRVQVASDDENSDGYSDDNHER